MKKIVGLFLLVILFYGRGWSTTSYDRSSIVINYNTFGWVGTNAGWQSDEWLISPTHVLDYAVNQTNRDQYPLSNQQFIIPPEIDANYAEPTKYTLSNDNVIQQSPPGEDAAELYGLWLTWDTNWMYIAVRGFMENSYSTGEGAQGNNIMVLMDWKRDFGYNAIAKESTWNKSVFTRGFDVDMYFGVYGGYDTVPADGLGGIEWHYVNSQNSDTRLSWICPPTIANEKNTSYMDAYYNGHDEVIDSTKRVLLMRLKMPVLLNVLTNSADISLPTLSSVTLKIAVATVDGVDKSAGWTYDFMPNNLAGMYGSKNNVMDNYFEIPFTDASGKLLMGFSPRYGSKINFLPGSRVFEPPVSKVNATVTNLTTGQGFSRIVFAPEKGESISLNVNAKKNSYFNFSIKIYDLRGDLIKEFTQPSLLNLSTTWDGKDKDGQDVPMGTYIAVFSGQSDDAQIWNDKLYFSVLR